MCSRIISSIIIWYFRLICFRLIFIIIWIYISCFSTFWTISWFRWISVINFIWRVRIIRNIFVWNIQTSIIYYVLGTVGESFNFFTGLVFSFSFSLETPMGSKSSLDLSPRVLLDGIIGRSFFILGKIDLCLLETLMMDVLLINMSLIWKIIKKHYSLPSLLKLYLKSPVIPIIQDWSTRSHQEI